MIELHPALPLFIGALALPLLPSWRARRAALVLLPLLCLWQMARLPRGARWALEFLGYELVPLRVDGLSIPFGWVFCLMALCGFLYALHVRRAGEHVAALLYVGSSLGVVFAGDLFTLFLFWELMAGSSVFLIWYRGDERALRAGLRYLLVHVFGGCCLLAGILIHHLRSGSLALGALPREGWGPMLMLLGFAINAAIPPLHPWLPDAYPEGTVTGSVFLTAYTTKSAVYVLARTFAGFEPLAWAGAIMALYGVVFAVLENDIRRLLAYHIVSQVGYMVCGVGMGTAMAIDGAVAHAFCHILYKALLFMGAGAVIHATGRSKLTDLQGRGLWRRMPLALGLYMVGALSISGVPLFNGFISKSMVVAAAGHGQRGAIELMLVLASVGTFLHTGLKLPYFTWFGGREVERVEVRPLPRNMPVGMGMAALLCVLLGVMPGLLYRILPYPTHYQPYTADHVIGMLGLLVGTALAFELTLGKLAGEPTITLDTDWIYRRLGWLILRACGGPLLDLERRVQGWVGGAVERLRAATQDPLRLLPPWLARVAARRAVGMGPMLGLLVLSAMALLLLALTS